MPPKHKAGGCGCCGCVPPTCTLTGSGGGTSGGNVSLTWTTTDADTVEIRDEDNTLISTDANGTSYLVSGGACKTYTLTATNDCGTDTCTFTDSCPDPACSVCELDSVVSTFTVQFTNNGVMNSCCSTAATRCAQFSGSFTVSNGGGTSCEWSGGTYGSGMTCTISRGPWTLKLKVQMGDCDGNNTSDAYAILTMSYPVVDPPSCLEFPKFQKVLGVGTSRVDCEATIPGTYTACSLSFFQTQMCDVDVVIS